MRQNHSTDIKPLLGLPADYFISPKIYRRVKENIYFNTWQLACHAGQVQKPGDYYEFSVFDQDIFIVRGKDKKLRAFYNVCKHRGHRLLAGAGNKRIIVCPYHAWTYDLTGQLTHAPNADKVAGFDAAAICLTAIRLEEFLGFVFVNLDENCRTMDDTYPDVRAAIVKLCPDIEHKRFAFNHHADEFCNWLIAVENYNECYHCKRVHRQFAKGVIDPNSYSIAPFWRGESS